VFDLGNVPKQRLVEVMVGIDKTRHHQHARARDGAVCRGIEDWRPCANGRDDVVVNDNIRILKFLPKSIARHKEGNVSDKRSHVQPPLVSYYYAHITRQVKPPHCIIKNDSEMVCSVTAPRERSWLVFPRSRDSRIPISRCRERGSMSPS